MYYCPLLAIAGYSKDSLSGRPHICIEEECAWFINHMGTTGCAVKWFAKALIIRQASRVPPKRD